MEDNKISEEKKIETTEDVKNMCQGCVNNLASQREHMGENGCMSTYKDSDDWIFR